MDDAGFRSPCFMDKPLHFVVYPRLEKYRMSISRKGASTVDVLDVCFPACIVQGFVI